MNQRLIFEDEFATLQQADFCELPGYLILRIKTSAQSLADLTPEQSQRFGALLAKGVAAIEQVVGADRVYCLSFCEVDRNLHFHLFPRTERLLQLYQQATGTVDQPANGPRLLLWAWENFPAGSELPQGFFEPLDGVCDQLWQRLAGQG